MATVTAAKGSAINILTTHWIHSVLSSQTYQLNSLIRISSFRAPTLRSDPTRRHLQLRRTDEMHDSRIYLSLSSNIPCLRYSHRRNSFSGQSQLVEATWAPSSDKFPGVVRSTSSPLKFSISRPGVCESHCDRSVSNFQSVAVPGSGRDTGAYFMLLGHET
jgi:hypothetical protein